MRPAIQLRMHNLLSSPANMHGSETWVPTARGQQRIETSDIRFLRLILGNSLNDKIIEEMRKRLQTENLIKEIEQYQIK